jgi:hypothetical protein
MGWIYLRRNGLQALSDRGWKPLPQINASAADAAEEAA